MRPARIASLLAALGVGGCDRCDSASTKPNAHAAGTPTGAPSAKLVAPLRLAPRQDARGFGMPTGCHLKLPVREAALPEGETRFFASRGGAKELVLATAPTSEGPVARRGIVDLVRSKVIDAPWSRLESPPAMDRTDGGWVAALSRARSTGTREAVLLRGGRTPERLVAGDQLVVADVACSAASCAVLTSLARAAAAPGASLFVGKAGSPAESWMRIDIEEEPARSFRPLVIASFDAAGARTVVALAADDETAFWSVAAGRATRLGVVETPHGVLDVVSTGTPLAIAPGRPLDECNVDRFPLQVESVGKPTATVMAQAAPAAATARPLRHGAFLAWVAPVSCRMRHRTVVHSVLLDESGRPASTVMAVADASGLALTTRGDEVDLWLQTGGKLSWLEATCRPEPRRDRLSPPATASPGSRAPRR